MANFSIPLGFKYRFEPEDHELIAYLSCKANGKPLPSEGVIKEIDLYSMNDPGKLFQGNQENIVYVFTRVKKVSHNGKRVDRKVTGNRTWKGLDKGHPIFDKEGFLVGEKKNFNLMNKMKMKLGYNMTEFVLDIGSLRDAKFKDYVLCQIKRKVVKGRSAQEEDICSSKTAIEEEVNSVSIASTVNLMPENSPVTNVVIPFTQSASEQYCSQNLLVTDAISFPQSASEQCCDQNSLVSNAIPFPEFAEQFCQFSGLQEGTRSKQIAPKIDAPICSTQSDSEQYCSQNLLVIDAVPYPESGAEQYRDQNSLVTNAVHFPNSVEQYCQFLGLQGGTGSEQTPSMVAFDDNTMTDSELFEASADWIKDLFPQFAPNQEGAAEQHCQISGLQEGTSSERTPSIAAADNTMAVSELFVASPDWINDSFPEFASNQEGAAEQHCQFSGLQEGSSSEQTASTAAFDNAMLDSELFVASANWINDSFPEFASNQEEAAEHCDDLANWGMINELTSLSPSFALYYHGMVL